ncbi:173_t:CDS:2 [Rhizophagus irregularis]|nr:173_t:CDS:2 [Rhizophagus irregularis]
MSYTLFPDFLQEISKLLEDAVNDFDVLIQVGQESKMKEFRAHSLILSARSPYFRTALSENLVAKKDGVVILKEQTILPAVFDSILRYIYSGEICYDQPGDISSDINQNATHALDILVAANELRLCKLINCTQIYLIEKQSSWLQQNLTGILQLSCRHEPFVKLRDYILEIVCKNPNALFESDDFLRLDETTLIYILKRDDLDMPEVKIWEGGGYCESKYYNHKRRTNDSFLFSLGNNQAPKLSRILRESANKAISWDAKSGPCFGDADLRMTGQSTNTSNWVSKTQFYEHSIANLETFSAEEFEVFQIEHCTIFRLPKFFEFPQLNDLSPSQISHFLEVTN